MGRQRKSARTSTELDRAVARKKERVLQDHSRDPLEAEVRFLKSASITQDTCLGPEIEKRKREREREEGRMRKKERLIGLPRRS